MKQSFPHNPPNMCTKCGGYTYKAPKWPCHKCNCQRTSHPESGLSDFELKLEKVVEEIRFCKTTLEGVSILNSFLKADSWIDFGKHPKEFNDLIKSEGDCLVKFDNGLILRFKDTWPTLACVTHFKSFQKGLI